MPLGVGEVAYTVAIVAIKNPRLSPVSLSVSTLTPDLSFDLARSRARS